LIIPRGSIIRFLTIALVVLLATVDMTAHASGLSKRHKSQVAIWVDTLIRYRQEGFKPRRTIKLALTCGEESSVPFNGASWLMANRRELIDAEFALNEGAWGQLDEKGNRVALLVEA